jgi:hypothetical protein
VYGEGRQRREFLYVTDWARAALTVLEHGVAGGIYNIGDGFELENIELARRICGLAGAPESQIVFVPDRPGHDFRYGLSAEPLQALGWEPQVSFARAGPPWSGRDTCVAPRRAPGSDRDEPARRCRPVRLVVTGAAGGLAGRSSPWYRRTTRSTLRAHRPRHR